MSRSLSKKLRFEVFKRDEFKCQYCGATPPSAILQVDHINPVASGGTNDMDNLVTSCQPCNLGKSKNKLSSVPESLREKANRINEAEEQIRGYQEIILQKQERLEDETFAIFKSLLPDQDRINKRDFLTVKNFINALGYFDVLEAAEIASAKFSYSPSRSFRYFCGICINKKKAVSK